MLQTAGDAVHDDVDSGQDASPYSLVVLGPSGITRDVIVHTLRTEGAESIVLSAAEADPMHTIVVVLVRPRDVDWQQARRLGGEIVVIIDTDDDASILEALTRGADAVITTRSHPQQLLDAIHVVAERGSVLAPQLARQVLEEYRMLATQRRSLTLTPRESEILLSIEQGDSIKQTARSLGISEKTVQNIQSRLFSKLGARNRAQAITRAYELGLLRTLWT